MRRERWNGGKTLLAVRPGKTLKPAQSVAGSADSGRWRMLPNRFAMTDTVCASSRDGCTLDARKGLRAGDKEVTRPLNSSAVQKRTVTYAGGGLQSLTE